ncbi:MAG: hypothetical protein AB3N09_05550 [Tateyamaria sp.]
MKYTLIPGESQTATEEETMSMIRSVLSEEEAPKPTAPKMVAAAAKRAFVARSVEAAPRRRSSDLPPLAASDDVPAPKQPKRTRSFSRLMAAPMHLIARVRAFHPTTRQLALVSMALLVVVRPHWFVLGAVLVLVAVTLTFLTFGADRIWRALSAVLTRIEARDNVRAAVLRDRLDRFACRWDAVLDLFPEGMVDGLYMPDLQALQQAEIDHQNVVARRLDRMVQEPCPATRSGPT